MRVEKFDVVNELLCEICKYARRDIQNSADAPVIDCEVLQHKAKGNNEQRNALMIDDRRLRPQRAYKRR